MNKITKRFFDAPPSKWDALVQKYNPDNLDDVRALHIVIVELENLAMQTTRLASYLRSRHVSTVHTDAAHLRAVKAQNVAAAQVRKALGYTYRENIRF